MTIAALLATNPGDDSKTAGGVLLDDPDVFVVGGINALADSDDATYVELFSNSPTIHYSPAMRADIPALPHIASLNSVQMVWRLTTALNAYSGGVNLCSFNLQIFRYYGDPMPEDYALEDTATLVSRSNSLVTYPTATDVTVTITSELTPADLMSGQLHFRAQLTNTLGENTTLYIHEIRLTVDYEPDRLYPLRQHPRDDGLRRNPARTNPTSRQGTLRRGPRGTYT